MISLSFRIDSSVQLEFSVVLVVQESTDVSREYESLTLKPQALGRAGETSADWLSAKISISIVGRSSSRDEKPKLTTIIFDTPREETDVLLSLRRSAFTPHVRPAP